MMQLGLVNLETGAMIVTDRDVFDEPECSSFMQLTKRAHAYGEKLRQLQLDRKIDGKQLDVMVIAFVSGMVEALDRELSGDEEHWLRQNCFDSARPWAVSA